MDSGTYIEARYSGRIDLSHNDDPSFACAGRPGGPTLRSSKVAEDADRGAGYRNDAVPRSTARHVRSPQEGLGIPPAPLPRELRPISIRQHGRPPRSNP